MSNAYHLQDDLEPEGGPEAESLGEFYDRFDEYARSGTEAVQKLRPADDGTPLNAGAAESYLADETERTETTTTEEDPACNVLGASVRELMAGPTISPGGGGGSGGRMRRERLPNSMERAGRQMGRLDSALRAPRAEERKLKKTDVERAKEAEDDAEHRTESGRGRTVHEESKRIKVSRVQAHLVILASECGLGDTAEAMLEAAIRRALMDRLRTVLRYAMNGGSYGEVGAA